MIVVLSKTFTAVVAMRVRCAIVQQCKSSPYGTLLCLCMLAATCHEQHATGSKPAVVLPELATDAAK